MKARNVKGKFLVNKFIFYLLFIICCFDLNAVSIVFNINGNPITDVDITERTKIMPASLNNRENARNAIIEDLIKLEYAKGLNIEPSNKDVISAIKEHKDNPQMKLYTKATLAWQLVIMHTIVPIISVGDKEIETELNDVERKQGLPIKMTLLRLTDVPKDIYAKFGEAKSCEDAEKNVRSFGGDPQKISANGYELSEEIRSELMGLSTLVWSPLKDGRAFLICEREKTSEWGKLDEIIRQNAVYKRALFQADQLLKQLKRKAIVN